MKSSPMKIQYTPTHDVLKLIADVRQALTERGPLTRTELLYQEQSRQWLTKSTVVLEESNKLLAAGKLSEAKKLCDDFNLERPRRRAGRPKTANPRVRVTNRVTLETVLEESFKRMTNKERSDVIEKVVAKLVDLTT